MVIRLFEMFAGYGGASFALKKIGVEHEVVGFSEIDKYAIQCYEQNHYEYNGKCENCGEIKDGVKYRKEYSEFQCGLCFNGEDEIMGYGDCTKIDPNDLPDFDLLTGGTPCQDFSVAGKGKGIFNEDGTITRSGLLFDFVRILKAKKPKYILWENVKGILTKKHREAFIMFLKLLGDAGYNIDFRLFNSKEHGIPQNRERVFVYGVRKDLNTLQVSS